ncbi:MAG: hypothetical protein WC389_05565 [Lutibacter sp.]|jgi:tetrahydromethanopterin S-methyltransferase subunit A
MKKLMRFFVKLFPNSATSENSVAVKIFYRIANIKDFFKRIKQPKQSKWPAVSGNYRTFNPEGQIAVCTLTTEDLYLNEITFERIAIIGTLMTPNLGIEKIIQNIITNSNIRYLVLCGKDSPVFKSGQAIQCLFRYGVNAEKRIKNAVGHFPVLKNLSDEKINTFLQQVELVDCLEENKIENMKETFDNLKLKEPFTSKNNVDIEEPLFTPLRAGGRRIPLDYDEKGFFIITINQEKMEIIVKHYYKDNHPGYIIKGRSSEPILLAILEKGLVSQMSHAGYLGTELAKARTALKLNLKFTQDQPLRKY